MKKRRSYIDSVHFYGRIFDVAAIVVMLSVPLLTSVHLDAWPTVNSVLRGLRSVALLYYPVAIIELITYTPMLGTGGAYLSFVTGNISNLKLPCALNAMENAKVRATSEEGEVISTISIGVSSIVTTVILAVGVLVFSPLLGRMTQEDSLFAPAFRNILPALFGALGAGYFSKHWKISIVPIAAGVITLLFLPTLEAGTLLFITIVAALLGTHIMYKKKIVT